MTTISHPFTHLLFNDYLFCGMQAKSHVKITLKYRVNHYRQGLHLEYIIQRCEGIHYHQSDEELGKNGNESLITGPSFSAPLTKLSLPPGSEKFTFKVKCTCIAHLYTLHQSKVSFWKNGLILFGAYEIIKWSHIDSWLTGLFNPLRESFLLVMFQSINLLKWISNL